MHNDEKYEILIKDLKDQLNQVLIRLRIHDIPNVPKGDWGGDWGLINNKKLSSIRNVVELLIEDLEKDNSNASAMINAYHSSYC